MFVAEVNEEYHGLAWDREEDHIFCHRIARPRTPVAPPTNTCLGGRVVRVMKAKQNDNPDHRSRRMKSLKKYYLLDWRPIMWQIKLLQALPKKTQELQDREICE